MKIFIGSSTESKEYAQTIVDILAVDHEVIPWWRGDVFETGKFYLESLHKIKDKVDAALMVFGEDDKVISRGKEQVAARDNVLLEYGLFSGVLGRENVAVVRIGDPKVPSDLLGLKCLEFKKGVNEHDHITRNKTKIKNWVAGIIPVPKIGQIETKKQVYTYVLNRLNPYQDISLTRRFLQQLPSNTRLTKISDIVNPLKELIHNYVSEFIKPDMRVYFAYKLINKKNAAENQHYGIGISFSEQDEEWIEGIQFGIPSNVNHVFHSRSIEDVEDAEKQINSDIRQNYQISDEGSVIALPILYGDEENSGECIGVVGISSPRKKEASNADFQGLAHELRILFSALFYSYGRFLQKKLEYSKVVEKMLLEIENHFETKFGR